MPAARLVSTLPEHFHYRGEPTEWVRITRPGLRLHSFLEGLTSDRHGRLYVADVPYGRIFQIDDGRWSEVLRYDGEPHGLVFDGNGDLLIADYRKGILRANIDSGAISVVCDKYQGLPFKGLSDLTLDADSNIWFTDPGRSSLADPSGRLFRRSPEGEVTCVLDKIPYPNGIAVTPDGAHIYVAVTRANAVWRLLRISPEQPPMAGIWTQLSGGLGPDGVAVNSRGEVAVAQAQAGRVYVFDQLGDKIAEVYSPRGLWTTSVRFDGSNENTLYFVEAQTGSILAYDSEGAC
jgi:gluconolactonase